MNTLNILGNTLEEKDSYNKNGLSSNKHSCNGTIMGPTRRKLKTGLRKFISSYKYGRKHANFAVHLL